FQPLIGKLKTFHTIVDVLRLREWTTGNMKEALEEKGLPNVPEDLGKKLTSAVADVAADKAEPGQQVALCVVLGEEGSAARKLRPCCGRTTRRSWRCRCWRPGPRMRTGRCG